MEPLPGLLDALASSGLSLVTVRLSKLWARLPPDLEPAEFASWVKQATAQHWDSRLALDPLSLRSLVSRSGQSESDVTLLPTSRSLALQQNRAGIQGRTPAQLVASVVYELLAGQPPQTDSYRPLAAIPDGANQRLKQTLANDGPDELSASELWLALKAGFPGTPQGRKAPTPSYQAAPDPEPSTGSAPPAPVKRPTEPQPTPKPDTSGPQKTDRARLWLILGSLPVLIGIILLGTWLSSHSWHSEPSPTPSPEPTVSPTPTGTLTPTPFNAELANEAFSQGYVAVNKGDYQAAIADYSEAVRLKPDFAEAYRYRAYCYNALGKSVEANRDQEKADSLGNASPSPSQRPH